MTRNSVPTYMYLVSLVLLNCSVENGPEKCLDKYQEENRLLFAELGFENPGGGSKTLTRWRRKINIQVVGEFNASELTEIDFLIEDISKALPIPIQRVESGGNVKINLHFPDPDWAQGSNTYSQTRFSTYKSGYLRAANIEIFSSVEGWIRWHCLRHEFLHALGLDHWIVNQYESSLTLGNKITAERYKKAEEKGETFVYGFTPLDNQMINMLYDDCFEVGLSKQDFKAAIEK